MRSAWKKGNLAFSASERLGVEIVNYFLLKLCLTFKDKTAALESVYRLGIQYMCAWEITTSLNLSFNSKKKSLVNIACNVIYFGKSKFYVQ